MLTNSLLVCAEVYGGGEKSKIKLRSRFFKKFKRGYRENLLRAWKLAFSNEIRDFKKNHYIKKIEFTDTIIIFIRWSMMR